MIIFTKIKQEGFNLKKTLLTLLAISAIAISGCDSKPKTEAPKKTDAAPAGPAAQLPPGHPVPAGQMPAAAPAGANPHANLKPQEIKAGEGIKAKVSQIIETKTNPPYIYLEVADAKGQKLWLALPKMAVKVGDTIEYPEAPVVANFASPSLKRTFDKLSMVQGIRVVK